MSTQSGTLMTKASLRQKKKKCFNVLASIDQFGYPINLNYEREETFKTTLGGCLSLFGFVVIVLFAVNRLVDLQLNRNWTLRSYEVPLGMLNESLQLSDLTNLTIQIELDPKHDAARYQEHVELIINITDFAEYAVEHKESDAPIRKQRSSKLQNSYSLIKNYRNRQAFVLDNKQLNIVNTNSYGNI